MRAWAHGRARAMMSSALAVALTVLAACHAPLADRHIARSWSASLLQGKVIVFAPFEQGTPSFGGGVDPGPEVSRVAQQHFDAADEEFAIAADYYQRQLGVARGSARASALRFRFASLPVAAYRAVAQSADARLSVSVDEKTFQVPKREALGALAPDADLVLVLLNRFERQDLIVTGYEYTSRQVSIVCASDFLLWDYDSERVVAEGRVKASILQQTRWIEPDAWQQLAAETMDQILRARPFVDD